MTQGFDGVSMNYFMAFVERIEKKISDVQLELTEHKKHYDIVNQKASVYFKTLGEAITELSQDVEKIKEPIIPSSNS